jgi:hypothetical protein
MQSSLTQLIIGTALGIGMSVVAVGAIGSAVAQSPIKRLPGRCRRLMCWNSE